MTCAMIRPLLGAHRDQELGPADAERVAAHLATCPDCAAEAEALAALSAALRAHVSRPVAPPGLRARVAEAARRGRPGPGRSRRWPAPGSRGGRAPWRLVAAWGSGAVMGAVMGATLTLVILAAPLGGRDDALIDAHVRSIRDDALVMVATSDQHQVRPWFAGRIKVVPPVGDFPDQGFVLVGGRVESVDGEDLGVLVYRHARHVITVYAGRGREVVRAPDPSTRRGFHLVHWREAGVDLTAVSDLGAEDLMRLVDLIRGAR